MNAQPMTDVRQQEFELLNEIALVSMMTQAYLSDRLRNAVSSVNWFIKRRIIRGWVKVTHPDRTRLKYELTMDGVVVSTQRAMLYARDSLKVDGDLRNKAILVLAELNRRGLSVSF
jgi:hypothetical protein